MLRLFLVTAPRPGDPVAPLRDALASVSLTEALAPGAHVEAARAIGAPHPLTARTEGRLDSPVSAVAVIQEAAARSEGPLLAVVDVAVARAVVRHALAAPVPDARFILDPGAYTEIEVRLDAPWTINRLNERCHEEGVFLR